MGNTFFSQEDADRIFDELKQLSVELDNDPLSFGPKRLNQKVAEVRRMLERCERVFLDCSQKLHTYRRSLKVEVLELDISKKYLFANDPETRAGRSVADREAIAAGKLQDQIHKVHDLDMAVQDLESVLSVIKTKRADLKDTEGRLRDQVRLCQEELGLGSRWGSKAPNAPDLQPGLVDQTALSDITQILQGVDEEINLARLEGTWTDPVPVDSETETAQAPEEPAVAAEPEEAPPPEVVDLMPSTATQQETDNFLSLDLTNEPPAKQKAKKPEPDDDGLESILKTFEDD